MPYLCPFIFSRNADFVSKYFVKGQLAIVVGSIQTRSWEQDGQKRYATEVVADEANFVSSKSEKGGNTQSGTYVPDAYTQPQFEPVSEEEDLPF